MKSYNHKSIESKWQKEWDKKKSFKALTGSKKKKFYSLMEFPYPSGDGLHTGHVKGYTAMDIISRKRRLEGFNVVFPIGFDAFGLPTENYAIKTGKQPSVITKKNTDNFRKQFKSLGMSFDWDREINTTDPKYYKWTQWIFLKFLEKGLAYKSKMTINWCPKDRIGLAENRDEKILLQLFDGNKFLMVKDDQIRTTDLGELEKLTQYYVKMSAKEAKIAKDKIR
jgi:leucyl-tRNA synthetase